MRRIMSSAGPSPAPLRPSVFISYASEDRVAARQLRDVLTAAGLEVWYDESELGGGDAWDQKIRRQIRDCDYFMPVISATTERRKEGYFRREWRLAAERTLDMADDVLFLVPVVIDDTTESGARVPEKFLSVQWLRAPGGQRTAALDALSRRLLAGEHTVTSRPPLVTRPTVPVAASAGPTKAIPAPSTHAAPPPMPAFPHAPEKGGVGPWIKFIAEVVWWALTAAWLVFTRLPRWVRVVLAIWFVFLLVSTCGGNRSSSKSPAKAPATTDASPDVEKAVATAAEQVASAIGKNATAKDWGKVGEEIARKFAKVFVDPNAAGKRLVLVPFAAPETETEAARFATGVFERCNEQLAAAHPADLAVSRAPLDSTDEALTTFGRNHGNAFILGGKTDTVDGKPVLVVRLIKISDGTLAWRGEFPVVGGDPVAAATNIVEAVRIQTPPRKRS
jgi:hypothetical protein